MSVPPGLRLFRAVASITVVVVHLLPNFPENLPLRAIGAKNGIPASGVISFLHLFPIWRLHASAAIYRGAGIYTYLLVFPERGDI